MKIAANRLIILSLAWASATTAIAGSIDNGMISSAVAQVLEEGHYTQHKLTPDISRQFLTDYLEDLDPDHLYFTREDTEQIFAAHSMTLGRDLLAGRLQAVYDIFDLYKKRVSERTTKIDALLKDGTFDFKSDRTVEVNRDKSPWPATDAVADQIWHDRVEGELLDDKLNGTPMDECKQTALSHYDEARKEVQSKTRRDITSLCLNSLARSYDPHSEYLRKEDLDDLDSDMSLSMVGIGVVIETQGRYTRIVSLLPGSPASQDGKLKVNDRIVAIARDKGEFMDIAGMSTDHVLDMIRGKPGTHVRLKVMPPRSSDVADRKEVELVSRNIELVDDAAKGDVIDRIGPDGKKERLGWISLPSFYGDPDQPNGRSVTRDVKNLLVNIKKENVSGLVLDMRNNPGGELEEAVGVAGLFLGKVPIVQEKDRSGKIYVSTSSNREIYDGPLVVLTDHLTASAAELLSCALQDYGRAVIVGGHFPTYGKGSVQTVVELGDVIRGVSKKEGPQLGALQMTIAKFYRVNGQSTQLRGLTADVQLPSPQDLPADGESGMKNPLQYDETKPVFTAVKGLEHSLPLAELKARSALRIVNDQEFQYLTEDLEKARKRDDDNHLSLNEAVRRAELDSDKVTDQKRDAARKLKHPADETVVHVNTKDVHAKKFVQGSKAPELQAVTDSTAETKQPDAIREEALNIVADLAELSGKKPTEHLVENSTAKVDRNASTTSKAR